MVSILGTRELYQILLGVNFFLLMSLLRKCHGGLCKAPTKEERRKSAHTKAMKLEQLSGGERSKFYLNSILVLFISQLNMKVV